MSHHVIDVIRTRSIASTTYKRTQDDGRESIISEPILSLCSYGSLALYASLGLHSARVAVTVQEKILLTLIDHAGMAVAILHNPRDAEERT